MHPVLIVLLLCLLLVLSLTTQALAKYPDDLPAPEKALADTVDPWGLPFSDSLRRFDERFTLRPEAHFALGLTHDLVKVWPNKYWFRGASTFSAPADTSPPLTGSVLWAAAGETQSLQIAVLPRMGAADATYSVSATVTGAAGVVVQTFREYFVRTPDPGYPRYSGDRWPDPLIPADTVPVSGTDCGVFWVDVKLPESLPAGRVQVRLQVTDGQENAVSVVPIQVVPGLALRPKDFPLVAWFRPRYGTKRLGVDQMKQMGALALEHHLQPMDMLTGLFHPDDFREFDATQHFLAEHGQNVFQLDTPGKKYDYNLLYQHVRAAGWLDQAVVYSNQDEPLDETFATQNIPYCQEMRQKYPGLRVFLASAYHDRMAEGCDIWMTDLSTVGYDPERMRSLKFPVLWNYYCHLPIHVQFRAPLTEAPNMEVDCDALQHRLALWMSNYYRAQGVFIWAGFSAGGLGDDFWQTLQLETKPSPYPYGGLHNGNNFLVYPPQTPDGAVLPSVRLKVLRAGMQDLAVMRAAQAALTSGKVTGDRARHLRELLNPVPGLFVHPQYWDRLPETLLARRQALLEALAAR
jgi:hypothetical protein